MAFQRQYDCIVIGGGHNGLIAAAYLAQAGKSVCVFERRSVLGGCACSEPLWPGYRVSTAAYVVSLLLPEIMRDLRLAQYGLRILPRNPSSFTPLPDGRSLLMGPDAEATRNRNRQIQSTRRGALSAIQRLPGANRSTPRTDPGPNRSESPAAAPSVPQTRNHETATRRLAAHMPSIGRGELWVGICPRRLELFSGAARPILERWFEADVLRATLATDAIIGGFASISAPGTAYVLLHHVMGTAGGARGIWGYVQGGMGGLADALDAACRDLRVDVVREAEVTRICTSGNRVTGVDVGRWKDGDRPRGGVKHRCSLDVRTTARRERAAGGVSPRRGEDRLRIGFRQD